MATKAKIRAVAKALCFRACTDCKSADECDPDKNWIEEALAILERPGPADWPMATKSLSILGTRGWLRQTADGAGPRWNDDAQLQTTTNVTTTLFAALNVSTVPIAPVIG